MRKEHSDTKGITMNFCVRDLVNTKSLEGVKVLEGEQYLDNEIEGVTIIEAPDIVKFINGGEVLLTGLYAFKSCTLPEVEGCIQELERKKISAVILKKGRNIDLAEEKTELFRVYARRSGTPFLSIPFDMSFKDVMQVIMERLFSDEVKRLKYFKTTRDNFEALMLSLKPEEDGIVKLLTVLGKLIGNPTGVYDLNKVCIGETKTMPRDVEILEKAEEIEPKIASNYQYLKRKVRIYEEGRTVDQYLVHLRKMFGVKMYLIVTETGEPLDVMDYIAIESAVSALQYELSRRYAVLELEKKYQNDILHNILNGETHSIEEMKKNVSLLGMSFGGTYRAVVFGMDYKKGKEPKDINIRVSDVNIVKEGVRRCFPKAVILNDLDKVIVVSEVDEELQEKEFRELMQTSMERLQGFIQEQKKNFEIKAGIGKAAKGIVNLKHSYREANDALEFLDVAGDVFGKERSNILMFSDMGILKLLSSLKTKEELQEYIPESLQKLYTDKKGQKGDLLLTLRTYLDYNQNLMKTAQELHVHYKTVAYRIEKIADITGMRFDDAREMLSVRIGIIVCKILDKLKNEK